MELGAAKNRRPLGLGGIRQADTIRNDQDSKGAYK